MFFGFNDFANVYNSRRVKGLTEIMHAQKSQIKQAKVFTVAQVMRLHAMLADASVNHVDRALAGYVLVALYSRCRHNDLAHVDSIYVHCDEHGGFVEISTLCHKTARTASQKFQFLPIVSPAIGVDGCEWPSLVMRAFQECGLTFEGRVRVNGPPMKPPSAILAGEV
jgi:hypothetical protein